MTRHAPMSSLRTVLQPRIVVAADDGVRPALVYRVAARLEAQGLDHEQALAGAVKAIRLQEENRKACMVRDQPERKGTPCYWQGAEYKSFTAAARATGVDRNTVIRHLAKEAKSCG